MKMIFPILTSFCMLNQAFAYIPKEGNITANLSPYFFKTDYNGKATNAPVLVAPSLIVVGDISKKGALELGMTHMNKRYIRIQNDKLLSEETQVIHITMGYRWWLNNYISSSVSFFSAYPMGNVRIVRSDYPRNSDFITSARDKVEYGFDFAAQGELWARGQWAAVAEARYSLSVTNRKGEHSNHYGAAIGVRYFIQSKDKSETNSP